jgi:DNA-binding IclR family transcriptional regulator
MGYIDFDRRSRDYSLSRRAALIGSWLDSSLVRGGPVVELMNAVCDRIGTNVVLLSRSDQYVRVSHVVQPNRSGHRYVAISHGRSLLTSPAARTLLSQMSDEEIKVLARRYNADLEETTQAIDVRDILKSVDHVRSDGAIFHKNDTAAEGWVIAAPLPSHSDNRVYALGVGDFSTAPDIDPNETIAILKEMIGNWDRQMTTSFL